MFCRDLRHDVLWQSQITGYYRTTEFLTPRVAFFTRGVSISIDQGLIQSPGNSRSALLSRVAIV